MISQPKKTSKAQNTKERIYTAALKLFAEKGYGETTLREIAKESGVSLGLAYRYFASKEELLLELYNRLTEGCAAEVAALPRGPMGVRFANAMNGTINRLQPHRDTLGSLFAVGLTAKSEMAVLGDRASVVRLRMWRLFFEVVAGSSDAPREKQREQMATLLYSAHLLIVLFWLQDRSKDQVKTQQLLAFTQKVFRRFRTAMKLPVFGGLVKELSEVLAPMFGPPPSVAEL